MSSNEFILGPGYSEKNYLVNELLATQNVRKWVVSRQSKYQVLNNLVELAGSSIPVSMQADNRQLRLPYLPPQIVGAQIKTGGRATPTTTTLTLQFTDSNYMGFINDSLVRASNGTCGKIIANQPGQITIQLIYSASSSATFQTADFAAGTGLSMTTDIAAGVSDFKQTRNYVPLQQYNVVGKQRYTYAVTREDLGLVTAIEYKGQKYWQYANYDLFQQNVKNSREIGMYYNPYVNTTDNWIAGGIEWQIVNQGGMLDSYNGTLSETKLNDIIQNVVNRGNGTTEFVVLCGSAFMRGFQENVAKTYLVYAGETNLIGGRTIEGINATVYMAQGVKLKFVSWPMLNSLEANSLALSTITGQLKSSYTALFLDTSPVSTSNGMQPFISRYHYGQDGYLTATYEGMINLMGQKASNPVLTTDTAQMDLIFDELIQLNDPSRHALLRIAA